MKRIATLALVAMALLAPRDGRADGFAVDRFEPSERGSDFFALESLDLRGHGRPAVGVVGSWGYKPLVLYDAAGNERAAVVRDQLVVHPGVSAVVFNRLRGAIDVPIQAFSDGDAGTLNGTTYPAASGAALGDVRLGADLRLFGTYRGPVSLAFGTQAWLPTGDQNKYAGNGSFRVAPRALVAGGIGPLQYAAHFGIRVDSDSTPFAGSALGSALLWGAGAGVRAFDDDVIFTAELFGSTYTDDPFKTRTTPFEGLVGARAIAWHDFRAGAGLGVGLARGYGTPAVRGVLAIEWAPAMPLPPAPELDRDHDGVLDSRDACPDVPGEATRDPKTNGCPPPRDRDHDGILDDEDACPNAPGPRTDEPRTNGCPGDRDGDGIIDPVDACPDVRGVEQQDPKKTGCPPDSDDDGIIDEEDACPDVKGIKSSDPKLNGCPDPDRDKDGVPNDADACPDEPGKADPDPKKNGCPKAFVQGGQIRIADQVKFQVGSAAIQKGKDSEEILEAVRKVLADHPEIKKVRIEGHTDNQGGAPFNKKLSADRAASVVKWLVAHGVDASRLTSEGFGQDRPLDTNATDAGRKNNRRVEFHIEE